MIVADLHIHSRFSRATARDLDPEHLWLAAQHKGVDLLGTGDFTHPGWMEELKEKLVATGDGAFALRPGLEAALAPQVLPSCRRPVRFLLSGEISCIYKRHGATRKVHVLVLMPGIEAVEKLNARLARLGNIKSDGRPILGLDARDLLELCLDVEPGVIFIPAHIWTPWFSLFGSKSGFDRIEDCFADLTGHIQALETGLSSDPAMNWRLSALDRFTLVSNSDAHSPANLAREANLLGCAPTYQDLAAALADRQGKSFAGTLEFFPDEGKYHLDGHRKCGQRLMPDQTRRHGGRCPVCGGAITVGVLSRVEDLADRPAGQGPQHRKPFESLVPLGEVLGEVMQRGANTKGVRQALGELCAKLGPELYILRQAPLEELRRVGGPLLAEAIGRMRSGRVWLEGGYDGEFGVVRLFDPAERRELTGQKALWQAAPAPEPPPRRAANSGSTAPASPPPDLSLLASRPQAAMPGLGELNDEQRQGVDYRGGHLILRAGPGTGKTRLLVARAASLLGEGLAPERLQLVTFTRKAAAELAERLGAASPEAAAGVGTFHSLGRQVLGQVLDRPLQVLDEEARLALVGRLAKKAGLKAGYLASALTLAKQRMEDPAEPALRPWFRAYQEALEREGVLDLDDLVRRAALALLAQPDLARAWQERLDHLLVDEYQDVNPAQVALIKALCGPATQVAAIGDPDQAIYGFRGAESRLFARFSQDFAGARALALTRNYRSTASILAAAQALISAQPDPTRPNLEAQAGAGPLPLHAHLPSPEAEAQWVAGKVVELLGGLDSRQVEAGEGKTGGGYAAGEVAVLYRLHAQAPIIAEALERAGVPVQVAAQEPLAETDPLDFKAQRVSLLSMHAAKGLEFPVVFVTGLEEGLLPYQPPERPASPLDEERRLLYVALTRARQRLYLSRATRRSLFGRERQPGLTPYLSEIPYALLQTEHMTIRPRKPRQMGLF
ncbi:MAG: UvrD-helicase domain-containing protein [Desulfarculus sp.]|nr:UvrD-helicase domain-containing protein [Desulfarculus sp.]